MHGRACRSHPPRLHFFSSKNTSPAPLLKAPSPARKGMTVRHWVLYAASITITCWGPWGRSSGQHPMLDHDGTFRGGLVQRRIRKEPEAWLLPPILCCNSWTTSGRHQKQNSPATGLSFRSKSSLRARLSRALCEKAKRETQNMAGEGYRGI